MAGRPRIEKTLDPAAYARLFLNSPEGQLVLEDLAKRFGGNPFVKGGLEGDRQTCFHAGENNVINFITAQINTAQNPE